MPWYEPDFIEEYERMHGRRITAKISYSETWPYDYISKNFEKGEERHIEVKKRKNLKQIALSRAEFDALKADEKYFLYWICWKENKEAKVFEIPQKEILKEGHTDFQFVLNYKKEYEKYLVK